MSFEYRVVFLLFIWLGDLHASKAAMPSTEEVGKILGFPSSELVIEEVTTDERTIMQTPSRREKGSLTALPDPADLLKAYVIRGQIENTFIPIQVYIGEREAFLTFEVLEKVDKFMVSLKARNSSWENIESLGRGGVYYTNDHKVKSEVSGFKDPSLVVAEVIVLQPHGQNFDVKIVMRSGLPKGRELKPIPGGESYYSMFGTSEDETNGPKLDGSKIALELSKTVIAGWKADQTANVVVPPTRQGPTQQTKPTQSSVVAPVTEPPSTPTSTVLVWWLGGIAIVILAFIVNALGNRRR